MISWVSYDWIMNNKTNFLFKWINILRFTDISHNGEINYVNNEVENNINEIAVVKRQFEFTWNCMFYEN